MIDFLLVHMDRLLRARAGRRFSLAGRRRVRVRAWLGRQPDWLRELVIA